MKAKRERKINKEEITIIESRHKAKERKKHKKYMRGKAWRD